MPNPIPTLSLLETRVLGTLAEKQRTVPDSYPLTLNALVSGCNQKTSRDPVMEATEAEVQASIDSLKRLQHGDGNQRRARRPLRPQSGARAAGSA